jgi:hypothetical protein
MIRVRAPSAVEVRACGTLSNALSHAERCQTDSPGELCVLATTPPFGPSGLRRAITNFAEDAS